MCWTRQETSTPDARGRQRRIASASLAANVAPTTGAASCWLGQHLSVAFKVSFQSGGERCGLLVAEPIVGEVEIGARIARPDRLHKVRTVVANLPPNEALFRLPRTHLHTPTPPRPGSAQPQAPRHHPTRNRLIQPHASEPARRRSLEAASSPGAASWGGREEHLENFLLELFILGHPHEALAAEDAHLSHSASACPAPCPVLPSITLPTPSPRGLWQLHFKS